MQGCKTRARGSPRGPTRGKPAERARRKARATAGSHSRRGRPPARHCRGTARGSGRVAARGPVFRDLRRPRAPGFSWSQARACHGILELCEWFRDCSQACGASQRVQRASASRPTRVAERMALHSMAHRAAAAGTCFAELVDAHLPRCSGSLPCQRSAHSSRRRMISACCAPRVASGCSAGRSGLSVRRPVAVRSLGARRLRFWRRARVLSRESVRACDPNPHLLHCARTCCSQRGAVRGVRAAKPRLGVAARVFRAVPSLGRWRCGSCARSLFLRDMRARLGRLPG